MRSTAQPFVLDGEGSPVNVVYMADDLADTYTYGVAIGLGDSEGH